MPSIQSEIDHCSSPAITEYNQAAYLVDKVTLPDSTAANPNFYQFTYEQTAGGTSGQVTGRLASVTLPTGASITYTYPVTSGGHNSINCSDGSVAASVGSTPSLARVVTPGGISPSGTWDYSRTEGASSTLWTTSVTDPVGDLTTINFTKDSATNSTNNFYETDRVVNQLISGSQVALMTTLTCYNGVGIAPPASCAGTAVATPITRRTIFNYLPTSSGSQSETNIQYDSGGLGLVMEVDSYDYGAGAVGAPLRKVLTSYGSYNGSGCTALGNTIVGDPCVVAVEDGSGNVLAKTTYSYDQGTTTSTSGTPQHVAITGSRGNLTTLTSYTSSTASLSKTFTYYDTGTLNVTTDITGAQTTYVYSSAANPYNGSWTASCGNSFATTINEPLSLSRSMQWNCAGGIAEQVTDENGQTVKSTYTDADFWRPSAVYDQENNESTISYCDNESACGPTAVEVALQNFNGGHSASDSRTTSDNFGRPTFSQRLQGPGATDYDTVESDYNSLGQPSRATMPYSTTASPSSSNTTAPATNTTYDALGRVLSVTDANGGTVSYIYTKNDVLQKVSGSQTFQKQLEYDGLGRLTSVCEISTTLPGIGTCGQTTSQSGYWTKYTYDALGDLLKVTQNAQAATANQQTRTFLYDELSRLLQETNPESGTTYYYYDGSPCGGTTPTFPGKLIGIAYANSSSICYWYDGFGRLSVSDGYNTATGSITCRRFVYDSTSNGIVSPPTGSSILYAKGRLVEAETDVCPSGTITPITDEWFSYSPRGEITDVYESTPHSTAYYHTTASYWPTGTLETLGGIPGVPTINFGAGGAGLDGEGRVTQVSASSGTNPVTSVTYSTSSTTNFLGALTGVTFGSTDSDGFTYDPNTGRMGGYTFTVNGNTDVGALKWNTNGTLNQLLITDHIPGTADSQTCNYLYDDLQRISTGSCGALWTQNFTYDAFGNISKSVPTGDAGLTFLPTYSTSPPTNRFTALPGITPVYDNSGNLLTDNLNTYTWNAYGNMVTVSTGSATVTSTYDALGRMVENNAGGSYTEFVYGPTGAKLAKANGTTLVKALIALPGGAKAIYNSTGLAYYRHSDWIGSSRLTSTAARGLYSSMAYAPFGEQYAAAGTADPSFTGQDSDTVSSLYDFPARRQSPSQGRWISPDPAGRAAVTMTNPQSWNRYAYVNNNPLALTDPMGLAPQDYCPIFGDDDNSGCGGDGGGGGGSDDSSGSDDNSGDNQNPPCVLVGAGIDNNMDNSILGAYSALSGAAVTFPYDSSVADTPGVLDGTAGGIMNGLASVADQAAGLSNGSTSTLANTYNNLASANCGNFTAVLASGSAQAFATGVGNGNITQQALGCTSNLIYLSPGAPGGLPATGIPTSIVTGNTSDPLSIESGIVGTTMTNTLLSNPLFLLDITGMTENGQYGHEPDQQLLDGASGLPTSSNCNSATTTGEIELPELPVWRQDNLTDSDSQAASM